MCAWCDSPIGIEPSELRGDADATSHGLCDDCVVDLLQTLAEAPRSRAA